MADTIYTRTEACTIVEAFEDVLDKYNIRVPSPEDEERSSDDGALYGTVFWDLVDYVENALIELLERSKEGAEYRTYEFDTTYLENGEATFDEDYINSYDQAKLQTRVDEMYNEIMGTDDGK